MIESNNGLLTIGEFADLTGLSRKALRLYDKRGLLRPVTSDPGSGYRRYSPDQVADGTLVAMLRAIDMPLAEIGDVLAADPAERSSVVGRYWYRVERALDQHRTVVRELRGYSQERERGMSYSERAVQRGLEDGAFAAVASLAAISDVSDAANAFGQALKSAYWDHKDLVLASAIAYAGAGRLLAAAAQATEQREADEARSAVKGLVYDLASFAWPGWDEPGVDIPAEAEAAGLSAARANLAMAVDLEKGDLPISRAHWMLGAHLLTSGEFAEARDHFSVAADFADRAGADAEMALARAFGALADLAESKPGAETDLSGALQDLEACEGGDMFVAQVETARTVLDLEGPRRPGAGWA
jgi:DNA-binding transcriptional MerR regulator